MKRSPSRLLASVGATIALVAASLLAFAAPAAADDIRITVLSPGDGGLVNTSMVTFVFEVEGAPAQIETYPEVYVDGWAVAMGSMVGDGVHELQPVSALEDGVHTAHVYWSAWQIPETVFTFTVDTIAPSAPAISAPAPGQYEGGSFELSGSVSSAEAGSVEVYDGSAKLGEAPVEAGGWRLPVTLAPGSHVLTATHRDRAGNVSAASAPVEVTVSEPAPDPSLELDVEVGGLLDLAVHIGLGLLRPLVR